MHGTQNSKILRNEEREPGSGTGSGGKGGAKPQKPSQQPWVSPESIEANEGRTNVSFPGATSINPGPDLETEKFTLCPDCNEMSTENDKAMQCDIFYYWFHTSCQGISEAMYEVMTNEAGAEQFALYSLQERSSGYYGPQTTDWIVLRKD